MRRVRRRFRAEKSESWQKKQELRGITYQRTNSTFGPPMLCLLLMAVFAPNNGQAGSNSKDLTRSRLENYRAIKNDRKPCFKYAHVIIEGQKFKVPRRAFTSLLSEGELIRARCHERMNEPIHVDEFWIGADFGDEDRRKNLEYSSFNFILRARGANKTRIIDTYDKYVEKGWFDPNKDLNSLKKEDGLYVYPYGDNIEYILVPVHLELKTPSGNPVLFYCTSAPHDGKRLHNCNTSFVWNNNILFTMRNISLDLIPPNKLKALFQTTIEYIGTLEEN